MFLRVRGLKSPALSQGVPIHSAVLSGKVTELLLLSDAAAVHRIQSRNIQDDNYTVHSGKRVKVALEEAMKVQRGSRGTVLLFL